MTTQDFVTKYKIGVSFTEMYKTQEKLKHIDGILLKSEKYNEHQSSYLNGLKFMLAKYLSNQTSPSEVGGSTALEGFDLAQFVRDYEDAKLNEFTTASHSRTRRIPFENVKSQALNIVLQEIAEYNKSLPDLWAERIKLGVTLDSFRNNADVDGSINALESAVLAHKAMEKVITERTWGWRLNPFNWGRLREENKFMRELTAKMTQVDSGVKQDILDKYSKPIISNKKISAFKSYRKIESTSKRRNVDQPLDHTEFKKPTTKIEARNLIGNKAVKDKVSKSFTEILKPYGNKNTTIANNLYLSLGMISGEAWTSPEAMHNNAIKMFKSAYNKINNDMPQMNVKDKLVAAQKIADIMLNKFTPIASDPTLEKYGNSYGIKTMDNEEIKTFIDYEGNVAELMEDVKADLGIDKEVINFSKDEFNEIKSDIESKIEEKEPSVPGLDK